MIDELLKERIEGLFREKKYDPLEIDAFLAYVAPMDSQVALATAKWYVEGTIKLPTCQWKIERAVEVALKAGRSPLEFYSPVGVLKQLNKSWIDSPIDPDTLPELSNKEELDYGVTIYDIEDSKEGETAIIKLLMSHFDVRGYENLLDSFYLDPVYVDRKLEKPTRVAFQGGIPIAFYCAVRGDYYSDILNGATHCWSSHDNNVYEGIPIDVAIPGDELGRFTTSELLESGEVVRPKCIHRGNRRDGIYEEWNDEGQLVTRYESTNWNSNGLSELWYGNGALFLRSNWLNGHPHGLYESWYYNGQLSERYNSVNGKGEGIRECWYEDGQLKYRCSHKNGKIDGLEESWYKDGKPKERSVYVNGEMVDSTEWYKTGQMRKRREGNLLEEWDENGRLRIREQSEEAEGGYIREEFDEKGRLRFRRHFDKAEGGYVREEWDENGRLRIRHTLGDGRQEWDEKGRLLDEEEHWDNYSWESDFFVL